MRGTNLRDGQVRAQRTMPRLKRWAPLILVPLLTLPMLGGLSAQAAETHTLQSVAVTAGTDGGILTVTGTTVTVGDGSAKATDTEYEPSEVVGDLPIRIRTAYRTAEGVGTDLADLQGYDGQITIVLTVENLTVAPQTLTYDVSGNARRDNALVGVPLTVVASTSLQAAANTVITAGSDPQAVTNGVLSRTSDGNGVIQWATVLAPPRLGTTAEFKLVLNAQDFQVPAFDIAVQRGYVTDPSSRVVLDAALNSGPASEAALIAATIEVINEVNSNLTTASEIVTKVKDDLNNSSKTLGVTTVRDLTTSSDALEQTMHATGTQINALGQVLSSSLQSSESSTVSQLLTSINAISSAFGDTSRQGTVPPIVGRGCDAEIEEDQADDQVTGPASVYEGIVTLNGYLHAYANKTDECKRSIITDIEAAMGPAEPDTAVCTGDNTNSMTCRLFDLTSTVRTINADLQTSGKEALQALQPTIVDEVQHQGEAVSDLVAEVNSGLNALNTSITDHSDSFTALEERLNRLSTSVSTLSERVNQIRTDASSARTNALDAISRLDGLSDQLCSVIDGLDDHGSVEVAQVIEDVTTRLNNARGNLSTTTCGAGAPAVPQPARDTIPMILQEQLTSIEAINAATDGANEASLSAALTRFNDQIVAIRSDLSTLRSAVAESTGTATTVRDGIDSLTDKVAALSEASGELDAKMSELEGLHDTVSQQVTQALNDSGQKLVDDVQLVVNDEVTRVTAVTQQSTQSIDGLMSGAANGVRDQGDRAQTLTQVLVDDQKTRLGSLNESLRGQLSEATQSVLEATDQSIGVATRDIEAARVLLGADLTRLLADLGTPAQNGGGFLGSVNTSAALTNSAAYQLALAEQRNDGYINLRTQDTNGILFEQAQVRASLQALAQAQPFHLPRTTGQVTTVYSYTVGANR